MLIKIPVITRMQDNGDGGYTMYVYNNEEEMLADHPLGQEFCMKRIKFYRRELTDEEKRMILEEDDPYKNGYIGSDVIQVEYDEVYGFAKIKPFSFHSGQ